jgi:hypothetical protein
MSASAKKKQEQQLRSIAAAMKVDVSCATAIGDFAALPAPMKRALLPRFQAAINGLEIDGLTPSVRRKVFGMFEAAVTLQPSATVMRTGKRVREASAGRSLYSPIGRKTARVFAQWEYITWGSLKVILRYAAPYIIQFLTQQYGKVFMNTFKWKNDDGSWNKGGIAARAAVVAATITVWVALHREIQDIDSNLATLRKELSEETLTTAGARAVAEAGGVLNMIKTYTGYLYSITGTTVTETAETVKKILPASAAIFEKGGVADLLAAADTLTKRELVTALSEYSNYVAGLREKVGAHAVLNISSAAMSGIVQPVIAQCKKAAGPTLQKMKARISPAAFKKELDEAVARTKTLMADQSPKGWVKTFQTFFMNGFWKLAKSAVWTFAWDAVVAKAFGTMGFTGSIAQAAFGAAPAFLPFSFFS